MKPFYKYSFIVAGCMVCIGLMFGIVGVVFGGHVKLVNMLENGELSWGPGHYNYSYSVSGNHDHFDFSMDDMEWDAASEDGLTYDASEISNMNLKIGGGGLRIKTYDGEKYKIVARNNNKYETTVKDGTLLIQSKDNSSNRRDITIYMPKDYKLEKVNINIGAGAADIDEFVCDDLDVHIGAGEFDADSIKANTAQMELGAGSIDINEADFGDTSLTADLGSISLDGSVKGDMDIKCRMGSAEIKLDGKEEDYNYKINCSAGTVDVGDYSIQGMGTERSVDNGGSYNIDIDCSMGSVVVDI